MNKIIIEQPWGGLGDNLQFSSLPEVGKQLGIEVWISNRNKYRNNEIKELVWDRNPYIAGFTDEPGNINLKSYINSTGNIISNWEKILFGIVYNHKPKIYYNPNYFNELSNFILIDPRATSSSIPFDEIIKKYPVKTLLINYNMEGYRTLYTNNIFMWIDFITSCREFVCQYSGGSVAIRAFDRSATVYISKKSKPIFLFKENNNILIS